MNPDLESLAQGVFPPRYARNHAALSAAEQAKLLQSRVALIGLGGLGGYVLEILARSGVGFIRAADGDRFEASNLNRQILCREDNLGQAKSQAALERAKLINSSLKLETADTFLNAASFPGFLSGCHLAIDALGGLRDRLSLSRAAREAEIPLISASLAGFSGQIASLAPGQTSPFELLSSQALNKDSAETRLGCPAPAVAFAASLICSEAILSLCGRTPALNGKILFFDLMDMSFEIMRL